MARLIVIVAFSPPISMLRKFANESRIQMQVVLQVLVVFGIGFLLLYKIGGMIMLLVSYVKEFAEWLNNNRQPRLIVPVSIIAKRTTRRLFRNAYFTTFQLESGERMELEVNGKDFGLVEDGEIGTMTYQGTRYQRFERSL